MTNTKKKQYTFIDLFAGCGGLSEGFYKQGYRALLHLEIDKTACKTLQTRMKYYGYSDEKIAEGVLCEDITNRDIIKIIDSRVHEEVDVIIGGPPCQAFSSVGRAQSPDSMNSDPRNYLFENYLDILNHFKPKFFVFENVKGLLTAHPNGVNIFKLITSRMSETYNIISDPKVILLNAADYGVPQIRERVILIGVRKDITSINVSDIYKHLRKTNSDYDEKLRPYVTVRDAIADLPILKPGEGKETQKASSKYRKNKFLEKVRNKDGVIYNHVARNHNSIDRERYRILSENRNWQLKDLQTIRPDLVHHDPKHFGNRYTVQEWDKPGRTVVAHLYKDGNLFIHPDSSQERTFTVREAARIQSFPDDFIFEGSRTDQFKQVGNAVPPILAEVFASVLKKYLRQLDTPSVSKSCNNKHKFIDLFCGAGGFSKGLEMAGLECIGGIEFVDIISKTHQLNHKTSKTICADIRNVPPEEFAKIIGTNHVEVIVGGPPCPTFSSIGDAKIRSVTGKPTSEDPRNQLFLEYLKYVEYFQPEIFVIENVPNFITKYNGSIFKTAVSIIENIGKKGGKGKGIYEVVKPVQVLNSVNYGVPQIRKRMMLVAHKKNGKKFDYPELTHHYIGDGNTSNLLPATTVKDAINDLPKITDNWRISEMPYSKNTNLSYYQKSMRQFGNGKTVMNNICRMSNDRAKKVFSYMKQGDKYMDLPPEVRKILPFREDIFHDRLKRLVLNEPSWTVIAHIGMDGYMYIHPTKDRTLSVREAARIQSFPDEFIFMGNQQETYVQVGNAVPPLLAKAIGKSIIKFLEV